MQKEKSQVRKVWYKNVPPKIRVMELLQNLRLKCSKMDRSYTKKRGAKNKLDSY